jgi:hypothetical protein
MAGQRAVPASRLASDHPPPLAPTRAARRPHPSIRTPSAVALSFTVRITRMTHVGGFPDTGIGVLGRTTDP